MNINTRFRHNRYSKAQSQFKKVETVEDNQIVKIPDDDTVATTETPCISKMKLFPTYRNFFCLEKFYYFEKFGICLSKYLQIFSFFLLNTPLDTQNFKFIILLSVFLTPEISNSNSKAILLNSKQRSHLLIILSYLNAKDVNSKTRITPRTSQPTSRNNPRTIDISRNKLNCICRK